MDEREVRVYTAPCARPWGLVVLFHGGGFVGGGLDAIASLAGEMASRLGVAVATPSYTLALAHPFPAAAEDAYAALVWAAAQAVREGWSPRRIVVAGIEAGGNLGTVAAMMARDRGGPSLAAQVLVAPMLDPTLTSRSMQAAVMSGPRSQAHCQASYRAYLPDAAEQLHPYASPASSSRLASLPPVLMLTARDDPLRDEAELYADRLVAAGVIAQVARVPRIEADDGRWCAQAWDAIGFFLRGCFAARGGFR